MFFFSNFFSSKNWSQPSQPLKATHIWNVLCSRFSQKVKLTKSTTFFLQFFFQKVKPTKSTTEGNTHIFLFFLFFPPKVRSTKSTTGEIKHSRFFFGKLQYFSVFSNQIIVNLVNHLWKLNYFIFFSLKMAQVFKSTLSTT